MHLVGCTIEIFHEVLGTLKWYFNIKFPENYSNVCGMYCKRAGGWMKVFDLPTVLSCRWVIIKDHRQRLNLLYVANVEYKQNKEWIMPRYLLCVVPRQLLWVAVTTQWFGSFIEVIRHYPLLTYLLTYSMEQSPSWKANRFAASQEIPRLLWNPKVHYRMHKCHLSLSWASSIQSMPPHPTSWRSILILSSHMLLVLPSGIFLSDLLTKALYTPFPSPIGG